MKKFKVFQHPSGKTVTVKQGWSWPAFFFSFIWALFNRMWGLGLSVLIGCFGLGIIIGLSGGGSGGDAILNIIAIVINIVFGINGNSWREKKLAMRGFECIETVNANNADIAISRFIKENTSKNFWQNFYSKLNVWYVGLNKKQRYIIWGLTIPYALFPLTGVLMGGIPWGGLLLFMEFHRDNQKMPD